MKTINILSIVFIFTILIGCEKDDNDLILETKDGISVRINDSIVYYSNQIDFYDFSSHLIYLKDDYAFSCPDQGTFSVLADNIEIYSGQISSLYSCVIQAGPVIHSVPFYGDYIIPIEFNQFIDSDGNSNDDPRSDLRIIESLKKHNQYREGLSIEILEVQKLSSNNVKIDLQLTNNDSDNLMYLDPDKMGLELFHYFTNGLLLKDVSNTTFTHKQTVTQPEPWDTWKKKWLSTMNAYETKAISIVYDNFETLTSGKFKAIFIFPGLHFQISKEDLQQANGRIWLGDIMVNKEIEIE